MSLKAVSKTHSSYYNSNNNPMFVEPPQDEGISNKVNQANKVADESLRLFSKYSRSHSYFVVGGIIINIAMLIYSHLGLSAVIKSSICPDGFTGCPDSVDTDGLLGVCASNPADAAILSPGNEAYDEIPDYMSDIGFDCLGADECIQNEVMAYTGISQPCAACFVLQADCSADKCLSQCLVNSQSQKCFLCSEQNCAALFENCTGIDFPCYLTDESQCYQNPGTTSEGRNLQSSEECFDKGDFELFKVFNLTFVNSIHEALVGGSAPLALLIILASGVWPYLKNILMLYAWFANLSEKRRDVILRILAILGKWSLVDVFAVVLIINGVNIQKILSGDSPLVVFAESRSGIYMFGIAAIWALAEGEAIRFLEKKRVRNESNRAAQIVRDPNPTEDFELRKYRLLLGVSASFALLFGLLGLSSVNLSFKMTGVITDFEGPDTFQFNTFQMGTGLCDDCALYNGHESIPGAFFLASIFIIMCAIIPIVTYLLFFVVALTFNHSRFESWFVGFSFGLGNFAAMDVFFLSMITLASQFEGLIEAAVGDGVDEQCGVTEEDKENGEFCIKFKGTIEIGAYLLLLSSIFFWMAQIGAGKLIQHSFKLVGPYAPP